MVRRNLLNLILLIIALFLIGIIAFFSYKIIVYFKDANRTNEIAQMLEVDMVNKANDIQRNDSEENIVDSTLVPSFYDQIKNAQTLNADVVGWIYIEDTEINYPVLKGDDNVYYLTHNLLKESSSRACIMLDAEMDIDDSVMLVYGHHMRDGSMFEDLAEYKDQEFFLEHNLIWLETRNGCSAYQVFATLIDSKGKEKVRNILLSGIGLNDLLSSEMLLVDNGDYEGGNLLVLTTCTYETSDAVLYIFAEQK